MWPLCRRAWKVWACDLKMCPRCVPGFNGCLAELHEPAAGLGREGFWWRPSWPELFEGTRPPNADAGEPGEWQRGRQSWASFLSDSFWKPHLLSGRTAARRAHLRSQSGRNVRALLACVPTIRDYVLPPHLFSVLLERLQLTLPVMEATCIGFHAPLDSLSRHRPACPRAGETQSASHTHRAHVGSHLPRRFNAFLRDMNVGVAATDGRRTEVLVDGSAVFRWSHSPAR